MPADKRQIVLVLLQSACIVFLLFSGQLLIHNIAFLLMQVFGLLFIFWAILAYKLNKTQTTELPKGFFLVTKGPYEIIRHPIYAGILLVMAGYVQGDISIIRFLVFIGLIIITLVRVGYEETYLGQKIKEYALYKTKTHRLIPYLY